MENRTVFHAQPRGYIYNVANWFNTSLRSPMMRLYPLDVHTFYFAITFKGIFVRTKLKPPRVSWNTQISAVSATAPLYLSLCMILETTQPTHSLTNSLTSNSNGRADGFLKGAVILTWLCNPHSSQRPSVGFWRPSGPEDVWPSPYLSGECLTNHVI